MVAHHLANGLVLNPLHNSQLHLQQKKIKGTCSLKVIVGRMYFDHAKPEFERVDQIFISIVEVTATLPHILSEVKQHAGEDYVIVTGDGLEVKESSGTEGKSFKYA